MARIVSLTILLLILVVIGVLFFEVMLRFFLPLFLAVLLVVMFNPLNRLFLEKTNGRSYVSAAATTCMIFLGVLIPLLLILSQAISECSEIYKTKLAHLQKDTVVLEISNAGHKVGLTSMSPESVEKYIDGMLNKAFGEDIVENATSFLVNFIIGFAVMIVSVFYFFADGASMLRAGSRLLPLSPNQEGRLIQQFEDISRTVVIATLVSAIVQGILVGLGFYFCGFGSIFLLTLVSMLAAMVPFIGAAAAWIPAVLWLYIVDGRTTAAVLLTIYGILVVSVIDNVVKPAILHGRSNLHPLLAFLSVLGGVSALGPIGIFVGPMLVVFLQTLIQMINEELAAISQARKAAALADSDSTTEEPAPEPSAPVEKKQSTAKKTHSSKSHSGKSTASKKSKSTAEKESTSSDAPKRKRRRHRRRRNTNPPKGGGQTKDS